MCARGVLCVRVVCSVCARVHECMCVRGALCVHLHLWCVHVCLCVHTRAWFVIFVLFFMHI